MTTVFVEVTATVSPDYVRDVGLPHSQHNLLPWLQNIGDKSGTEIVHLTDSDTWQICGSLDCVVKAHRLLATVTMVTESCPVPQEVSEQRTPPVMTRLTTQKRKASQSVIRNQPHRSVKKERCTKGVQEHLQSEDTDLPCHSGEDSDEDHHIQSIDDDVLDTETSVGTAEDMVSYKQDIPALVNISTQTDDSIWQMKLSPLESVSSPSNQQLEFAAGENSPESAISYSSDCESLDVDSKYSVIEAVKAAVTVQTHTTKVAESLLGQPVIHGPLNETTTQTTCKTMTIETPDPGAHCIIDEIITPSLPISPTDDASVAGSDASSLQAGLCKPEAINALLPNQQDITVNHVTMPQPAPTYREMSQEQLMILKTLPHSSTASDRTKEQGPVQIITTPNVNPANFPVAVPQTANNGSQPNLQAPVFSGPVPDLQAPISIMNTVSTPQKTAKGQKRTNKDTEGAEGESKKAKKYLKIYDSGTCHECGKTFSSMSNMHRHIKIVHQGFRIKCKYCDRTFTSKDTVDRHVRVNHDDLKCADCGLIFESDVTRGDHNCTRQKMESYQCPHCSKTFPAMCNLKKHIRVAHLGQQYDCDLCSKQYKTKHGLYDHFRHTHNIYKCNKCSASFEVESQFVDHIANFHNAETSSDKSQKKSPVQVVPSECPHCDKKFATPCNLEKHILAYHSQDSLPCDRCGKVFANERQLERHIQIAHAAAQHICYCGEQFTSRKAFTRHQTTAHQKQASPTGTYQCDVCGSQFLYESNLNRHINRDHVGIRYPCNVCDKEFKTKLKRQEHEEVEHKGLRFNCGVCPKLFKVKYKLKQHILAHHAGEKFTCDICNKTFVSKEGVQTHQRTQHAEQYKANKTAKMNGSANPPPLYSSMQMPAMDDSLEQIKTDFGASLMTALDPNFLPLSPPEASNSNNDLFPLQTYTAILQDTQEFSAPDPNLPGLQPLTPGGSSLSQVGSHSGPGQVDQDVISRQSGPTHVQSGVNMDAINTMQTNLAPMQPQYTSLQNSTSSICSVSNELPSLSNVLAPLENGLMPMPNALTPLSDGLPPAPSALIQASTGQNAEQEGLNPLLEEISSNQTELTTLQNQVSTLQSALTAIEARLTPLQPVSCGESPDVPDKSDPMMLSSLLPEVTPPQTIQLSELYGSPGTTLGMDLDIPASLSQLVSLPYLFVDQTAGSNSQDSGHQLASL